MYCTWYSAGDWYMDLESIVSNPFAGHSLRGSLKPRIWISVLSYNFELWVEAQRIGSGLQTHELSFLYCVSGQILTGWGDPQAGWSRTAALLFWKEPNEVVWASNQDTSLWGCSGKSQLEGDPEEDPEYAGGISCPIWPRIARRSWRTSLGRRICQLPYLTCCQTM